MIVVNNTGVDSMIKFDKLWITMDKKNVSTYMLREKCGLEDNAEYVKEE